MALDRLCQLRRRVRVRVHCLADLDNRDRDRVHDPPSERAQCDAGVCT